MTVNLIDLRVNEDIEMVSEHVKGKDTTVVSGATYPRALSPTSNEI